MGDPTLRLRHQDMLRALDGIDLLDVVAQELIRRVGGAEPERTGRSATEHTGVAAATDLTAVEDPGTGQVCLMPTPSLHMISLAALACLAARELLPPGVVTTTVFGTGPAARLHVALIARYITNISHAAVHPAALESEPSAGPNVRAALELADITLSVNADSRAAALGANLLVIAELGWDRLEVGQLHPGVLVINSSCRDLPDELLAQVDRVYVDDIGQLEHNQHRKFVRLHLTGSGKQPDPMLYREGWYQQRQAPWRYQRRIETDLGQLVAGGHKRTDVDDVLLVELLNGSSMVVRLAGHIYRAALALGLGVQNDDSELE